MVRNTTGGTGHKAQASKFQDRSKSSAKTRFVKEEGEVYAYVTKNLGNGMCHVMCEDDVVRLCIIRGKFRGRGKKDNIISNGKWIMVGIRDYESTKEGKLENCDLLEVYGDIDKERLKAQESKIDWKRFIENDCAVSHTSKSDATNFEFSDKRADDYNDLMKTVVPGTNSIQFSSNEDDFLDENNNDIRQGKIEEEEEDDDVDVDDI